MNAVVRPQQIASIEPEIIANLVTTGDLSRLNPQQRIQYYNYRCQQAGLDPAAQPFSILRLNGREVLYANASCTQQLCGIHKLSVEITSKDKLDDLYVVCARVKSPDGRASDNMGAVPVLNLKGEALANAMLKATTKAIRRTVLAHLGLGMLDETEVQTIPGAQVADFTPAADDVRNDPRGDLSSVENPLRDKHVSAITDILNADIEENAKAEMLRTYVADFLHGFNELYIAVADELAAQKIVTKAQFKAWLKVGLERKHA